MKKRIATDANVDVGANDAQSDANYSKSNKDIAAILDETGDLLALSNDNPFRIRAYRNAARTVRDLERPLRTLVTEPNFELTDLPGIGKDLAGKISDIIATGSFAALRRLRQTVPTGTRELMQVSGIGPKKARLLESKLGVHSIGELKAAVAAGRLRSVKGFGLKTAANLAKALDVWETASGRMLTDEADQLVTAISHHLASETAATWMVCGSFRRGAETIGDIDLVATAPNVNDLMQRMLAFDPNCTVLGQGPTKLSIRLQTGRQVDLRLVPAASFGAACLYFTGSKSHNIELRRLSQSQGLKLNEYGLFRDNEWLAGRTEVEVYNRLGLAYIDPELREGRGEITLAAKGLIPKLVCDSDILGDLHVHTNATDGRDSIETMVDAAIHRGYRYVAITDHSRRVTVAHGLDQQRLAAQWDAIDVLAAEKSQITILKGVEVDILDDGALDISPTLLKGGDWVVAALHYHRNMPKQALTRRIVRALDSGVVQALAHPYGRIIGTRDPLDIDLDEIARAAAANNVALEINGQPTRLDLNDKAIEIAERHDVNFVVATDAHSRHELEYMKFAVSQARRGGLTAKRIINTRTQLP